MFSGILLDLDQRRNLPSVGRPAADYNHVDGQRRTRLKNHVYTIDGLGKRHPDY
jgi:hypothetical protein